MLSIRRKKDYFFLTIAFFCASVMCGEVLYIVSKNIISLTTGFIIGYIAIFLRQLLIGNLYSLYSFYLITSAFFMYDKFIVGPLLGKGVMSVNFVGRYVFPDWVGETFVFIAVISVLTIDILYTIYNVKSNYLIGNSGEKSIYGSDSFVLTDDFYYKLGLTIMCCFIVPIVYKIILQVQYQKSFANYAIANFTGQEDKTPYPWWTKGSGTFFYIGFFLFIYSFPPIKKVKYGYFLFFIMMLTTALKGGRAFFFTYILTLPLLYKKLYNRKLPKFALPLLAILCVGAAIFLGNFRSNITGKLEKGILWEFLDGQTSTMGVPYVYIENHGELPYKHFPFIFNYLLNPIRSKFVNFGNNASDILKQSNNYGGIALYMLNPRAQSMGGGLGLNFLTEAYDFFGYFGVFFWSAILAIIMKLIDCMKYTSKNRKLIVVTILVYQYTLFLPRHSFFGITDHIKYVIMFYILYLFLECRKYIGKIKLKGEII